MMTRINEIILKSGKKKKYLAQKLNVTPSTLTRYCKGTVHPNYKIIEKLALLCGVDVSEFFLPNDSTNI
jgi:transcriptional regulator with XRE-family HTH domain